MQFRVIKDWEALAMLTKQTDIVIMHFWAVQVTSNIHLTLHIFRIVVADENCRGVGGGGVSYQAIVDIRLVVF